MIKLFITDLDGCISTPFKAPEWSQLAKIRRLNEQSSSDLAVPPLSICSGRPMPYVEAVAQWLNIQQPVVFENAGMYELSTNNVELLSVFDEKADAQVKELKKWLQQEFIDHHPGMILEFTKRMDAGFIHTDSDVIDKLHPVIKDYVEENFPNFEVHKTDVSMNIILSGNNKQQGIEQLCKKAGIKTSEVAYIGDSSGDIPGLEVAGMPFAPENAHPAVKEHATELPVKTTEAVLMAYRRIIQQNREELSVTSSG